MKTARRRSPTRLNSSATTTWRSWENKQLSEPCSCTPGRVCLSDFFAFTARSVQTTRETPHERRQIVYHPQLSQDGPRSREAIVLRYRLSRRTDRSSFRGSATLRGFSNH